MGTTDLIRTAGAIKAGGNSPQLNLFNGLVEHGAEVLILGGAAPCEAIVWGLTSIDAVGCTFLWELALGGYWGLRFGREESIHGFQNRNSTGLNMESMLLWEARSDCSLRFPSNWRLVIFPSIPPRFCLSFSWTISRICGSALLLLLKLGGLETSDEEHLDDSSGFSSCISWIVTVDLPLMNEEPNGLRTRMVGPRYQL